MSYIEDHKKCSIKVGDKVQITRTAGSHEGGWGFPWVSSMDKSVGKTGIVKSDGGPEGFVIRIDINNRAYYPYF